MQNFFLLSLLLFSELSYGASFNCAKASSFVEHSICNDAQASKLDEALARAYKNARASVASPSQIKKEQRAWLKNKRNTCQNIACVKQSMKSRIRVLKSLGNYSTISPFMRQILGTYQTQEGDIKLSIRDERLYFKLLVVNSRGHIGDVEGYIRLTGKEGYYKNTHIDCFLKFKFKSHQVHISQEGVCDMGMGVYADGIYK